MEFAMPVFAIGLPSIGGFELIIVLVLVLILFGAGRLPQVFRSLGEGIKSFKDAQKDDTIDVATRSKQIDDKVDAAEAHEVKERA